MQERFIDWEFIRSKKLLPTSRWQTRIIYVLTGIVKVDADDTSWVLNHDSGNILVANPNTKISLQPQSNTLVALAHLDMYRLWHLINDRQVAFSCNPSMSSQASYSELAHYMDKLISAEAETGDFADLHISAAEIGLIQCLLDGFGGALTATPSREQTFARYLDLHFDEPVTLADAARHFHLSTEHFAKVFKAELHETFHTYLTKARLHAAIKQLEQSNLTVSRIALEAGFPNASALNQAFKEHMGQTPSQYRKDHSKTLQPIPRAILHELQTAPDEWQSTSDGIFEVVIDAQSDLTPLHESWRDMIGLGRIETLSEARVREQTRILQSHLGFRYYRVECNFSSFTNTKDRYVIDDCFDFLVENGFTPHVVMVRDDHVDQDAYLANFSDALRRFSNRYSIQTLRTWRFELLIQSSESKEPFDTYLNCFSRTSEILRPYGMSHLLAGPCIIPDQQANNLRHFLNKASKTNIQFAAITIICRPGSTSEDMPFTRTADRHYLRNQVLLARNVLAEEGYDPNLLAISSWQNSIETHNVMNDSCYEGANIIQTILSTWNLVGSLSYNHALDFSVTTSPGDTFLSGRPGLISRDGLLKPSYWAFDFLGRIQRRLIYADSHCLASTNDMGNYQLVVHNCERLNITYLTTPERLLDFQTIDNYFEDQKDRLLHTRIIGARPGTYLIKTRYINSTGGSVGDEALRMRLWSMDEPSRSEIAHLTAAAQPQMLLERVHTSDGIIEFEHILKSNEIAYFHVIYLY